MDSKEALVRHEVRTEWHCEKWSDKIIIWLELSFWKDSEMKSSICNLQWSLPVAQQLFGRLLYDSDVFNRSTDIKHKECPYDVAVPDMMEPPNFRYFSNAKIFTTFIGEIYDDKVVIDMRVTIGEDREEGNQAIPEYWRFIDGKRWPYKKAEKIFGVDGIKFFVGESIENPKWRIMRRRCPANYLL